MRQRPISSVPEWTLQTAPSTGLSRIRAAFQTAHWAYPYRDTTTIPQSFSGEHQLVMTRRPQLRTPGSTDLASPVRLRSMLQRTAPVGFRLARLKNALILSLNHVLGDRFPAVSSNPFLVTVEPLLLSGAM